MKNEKWIMKNEKWKMKNEIIYCWFVYTSSWACEGSRKKTGCFAIAQHDVYTK
jgi:hypothetical protein